MSYTSYRPLLKFNSLLILMAMLIGLTVAPASAQVSPPTVDDILEPGESLTVTKTINVPEVTPKLDLLLIVDLSGSYYDDLPNIKSLAPTIFDNVAVAVPDSQFGLATFVDFPFNPWGGGIDYAYQLNQDLTPDKTTWVNAVNAMSTFYGGDGPESQLEALYQAATGEGRQMPPTTDGDFSDLGEIAPGRAASWRSDATKVVAITTDASFHVAGDYGLSFPYPGPSFADTVAALNSLGAQVIAIKAPGATTQMNDLAAATGGVVKNTGSSSAEIADAIVNAITELTFDITAEPVGCDGLVVSFDPAGYTGVAGGATVTFQETISVPADSVLEGVTCKVDFKASGAIIGTQNLSITIPQNEPPVCSDATPSVASIWPPNHKFVPIQIQNVSDPDGDPVSIVVTSIFQDEPVDTIGDGNFVPDGQGVGTAVAEVRAERVGTPQVPGDGRVYYIGFTAGDGLGGSCSGQITVDVPHDQGQGSVANPNGPFYDATVP